MIREREGERAIAKELRSTWGVCVHGREVGALTENKGEPL